MKWKELCIKIFETLELGTIQKIKKQVERIWILK